jgi:1-acyl-sn-glycerol-3-phosphate acyltransferase
MKILTKENIYQSPKRKICWLSKKLPSWIFYPHMISIVYKTSQLAQKNQLTPQEWVKKSLNIVRLLETLGANFKIENYHVIKNLKFPCVFVSSHMSTLETFVLPGIIQPYRDITFIVKASLMKYPLFKHTLSVCDPIVVTRKNPRQDLQIVLKEGRERIKRNISVIVFPQTTRTIDFEIKKFNTLGIKLAKRTNVPIVPIALKTDAWGNGKWIKDFGKIDPTKSVRFCFGNPVYIKGNGKQEHETIINFIQNKLRSWV